MRICAVCGQDQYVPLLRETYVCGRGEREEGREGGREGGRVRVCGGGEKERGDGRRMERGREGERASE